MKAVLLANTAWYLYNHRISLARSLEEQGVELLLASPPDEYVQKLREEGFSWQPISMSRRGFNPIKELITLIKLARFYRSIQPDVVHHFTAKPVIYGSLAARWAGVPTIINAITGLGYLFMREGLVGKILRMMVGALYRLSLRNASIRVVFQNRTDLNLFVESGWVRAEQSVLIPGSGVDIDQFVPAPEPETPEIILMVGRMLWDKGVADFVEAAKLLRARGLQAEFHLVGGTDPGNPAAIPENLLLQWSHEGTIHWKGRLDRMPEVYARSTIVVLPSYREGLPRTLIEAAAVGRPLVATDIPGCRDVVRHGINGLLVPPKDPARLADAIEELLEAPKLRSKMGKAGREIVSKEFSNERIVKETLALYPKGAGLQSPIGAETR